MSRAPRNRPVRAPRTPPGNPPRSNPERVPGPPVEVVVDGFTHGGEGVARLPAVEGRQKAVFVPGTIPGERVRIQVVDERKNWARAELLEVLEPAAARVTPPCPYVPDCGGCDLQHIAPDHQRELKTRVIREQLERLGGLTDPPVADTLAVGPDTGYRNHAQFHADADGRLGFHRSGSHDVVPIDRCLVLADEPQQVRDTVGDDTGAVEVSVRGQIGGDRAAVLAPGPGPLDLPEGDLDILLRQPDGRALPIRGDGTLTARVGGLDYTFDAASFFQVNTGGAEAIVAQVMAAAGDVTGALAWDLYAGVGLLSLPLAAAGADVVAVEGDKAAAARISENAERAGLTVTSETSSVQKFVADARAGSSLDRPDLVVLDPPRQGAGERLCRDLADLLPGMLIYVACDVASLARDARVLVDAGFRFERAQPLDLFPMTHHVEVVASFTR